MKRGMQFSLSGMLMGMLLVGVFMVIFGTVFTEAVFQGDKDNMDYFNEIISQAQYAQFENNLENVKNSRYPIVNEALVTSIVRELTILGLISFMLTTSVANGFYNDDLLFLIEMIHHALFITALLYLITIYISYRQSNYIRDRWNKFEGTLLASHHQAGILGPFITSLSVLKRQSIYHSF